MVFILHAVCAPACMREGGRDGEREKERERVACIYEITILKIKMTKRFAVFNINNDTILVASSFPPLKKQTNFNWTLMGI